MNKGLLGKVSLFSVILLAIALILIFVLPVFSIPFTSSVNPTDVSASTTNQILNFTIVNTNATGNITQVNITLPAGFGFIAVSNTTTATNTSFSNTTNAVSWTNTTTVGFITNGSTQYFFINVSVPSVATVAYNFNVSTLDKSGNYNSTNVTVTVNDTTFPTWSNSSNVTSSNYSSSTLSQFNITWTDNVNISTVLIEGNWSNSNASMTPTYGGGIYNYSAVLPAGVWQWKSYANDTRGNMNSSSSVIIYIAQAMPTMTLTNATVTYPTPTTINGSVVTGDPAGKYNISLYRNNSLLVNSSISASFTYETNTLGVGLWNYTLVYNGTQNYSSTSITNFTLVSQGLTSATLYINGSTSNQSSAYPNSTINVTAVSNVAGLYVQLWENGALLLSNSTSSTFNITKWGVGYYNFTVQVLGNSNYSSSAATTLWWNVSKGTLSGSITGSNTTYPNPVSSITPSVTNSGASDVNYTLYRNNSLIGGGYFGNSPAVDTPLLGVGSYVYVLNTTNATFENWTSNSSIATIIMNVTKGDPASAMNISINGILADSTLTYPNATNVTGWSTLTDQSNLTFNLYGNTTGNTTFISNSTSVPYNISDQNLYGVKTYVYIFNTSGNANYTSGSVNRTLTISQGTPSLVITGFGTVTYPSSATVVCTATSQNNEVTAFLYRNGANASSTTETVSSSTTVVYNYTCNSSSTANYTAGQATPQTLTLNAASSSSTTGGSIGGITTTGMITYINLAVGKANITANYLTTSGKLIANIARYQDVAIRGMNVTVVNNVANIKIMISKLPSLPSNVPYDINGKVYNYISTSEQNFTDADIKSVNISFAVNKTWLTNNNIDASNITLYRWANNKWNDLNAVKVSDDGKEVFFTVGSPGLSVFIIGTKGGAPAVTETPAACTESWTCTDWSTCSNSQQTRTCTDANSCGTTTSKPSESQSCTVNKGETTVVAPVQTSILTTVIVIVVAIIACVFIFLQRTKISSYLVTITKKSNNHKKTSYLESLARKTNNVEEEEEEKFTDI